MKLLGRQTPELPAEVLVTQTELTVLRDLAHDRKLPEPTTLGGTLLTMAIMAGSSNRKGDAAPGHQDMWEGHTDLNAAPRWVGRILRLNQESPLIHKLSPDG